MRIGVTDTTEGGHTMQHMMRLCCGLVCALPLVGPLHFQLTFLPRSLPPSLCPSLLPPYLPPSVPPCIPPSLPFSLFLSLPLSLLFTLLFCLPPHMKSFLVTHGHRLPHPCCVGVCSVGSTHSTHSMGTVHVYIQYGKQWCGVMYCVHVHCFVGTYIPVVYMWLYSHMGFQYSCLASCLSSVSCKRLRSFLFSLDQVLQY